MIIDREILAGIFTGLSIFILVVAIYQFLETRFWGRRMHRLVAQEVGRGDAERQKIQQDLNQRPNPQVVQRMNQRLGRLSFAPQIRQELVRAGMKITIQQWLLIRVGAVAGGVFLGLLLGRAEGTITALSMGGLLGALGLYLPRFYLKTMQSRRANALEKQLTDAIDIMAGALEAGSSLPQSLTLVSRELAPPIGEEFTKVVRGIELGLTLEQALIDMTDRVRSEDLVMLVTAINIQYRVGGNLAQVLRTIAVTIRERVRIKGEIRVLTAQQRLSGYVIAILPFGAGVMLYLANPKYMGRLLEPGITRYMALTALVMMIAGFLALRKIVDIKV